MILRTLWFSLGGRRPGRTYCSLAVTACDPRRLPIERHRHLIMTIIHFIDNNNVDSVSGASKYSVKHVSDDERGASCTHYCRSPAKRPVPPRWPRVLRTGRVPSRTHIGKSPILFTGSLYRNSENCIRLYSAYLKCIVFTV